MEQEETVLVSWGQLLSSFHAVIVRVTFSKLANFVMYVKKWENHILVGRAART